MSAAPIPDALQALADDVLWHELVDWSLVLQDENGDLPRSSWAKIDALLDELAQRLKARQGDAV